MYGKDFLTFLLVSFGALFFWTINGFKGSWQNELSGPNDTDRKHCRNLISGLLLVALIGIVIVPYFLAFFDDSTTRGI